MDKENLVYTYRKYYSALKGRKSYHVTTQRNSEGQFILSEVESICHKKTNALIVLLMVPGAQIHADRSRMWWFPEAGGGAGGVVAQ